MCEQSVFVNRTFQECSVDMADIRRRKGEVGDHSDEKLEQQQYSGADSSDHVSFYHNCFSRHIHSLIANIPKFCGFFYLIRYFNNFIIITCQRHNDL